MFGIGGAIKGEKGKQKISEIVLAARRSVISLSPLVLLSILLSSIV